MTARRRLTRAQRVRLFDRDNGICWRCKLPIRLGEKWHVGHIIGLACGGTDDESNMAPEHESCNLQSAREDETPRAAKIKRVRARHLGIRKRSGFRGWRKFNGDVVWNEGRE